MPEIALQVEPTTSDNHGVCSCCGNVSLMVSGNVERGAQVVAVYFVHWTHTRVNDHEANFDFILGDFDDESPADRRQVVAVAYRLVEGNPEFMVIDAANRPIAKRQDLAAAALRRDQVIGTPLAAEVFAMLDAICASDGRIAELAGGE